MSQYEVATTLLYQAVSPVLIVLGTFGNVLTIIVLARRNTANASTMIFLMCLAVSDLLVLNTGLMRYWIRYTFGVEVRHLSVTACRLQRFAIFLTTQFSSWMLVCVTIERLVSTWSPHRRSTICNRNIAIGTVCAIGVMLVSLNSHYLLGFGDKWESDRNVTVFVNCVPLSVRYEHFIEHEWTIIDMCVFYLVPMVVLVVGNSAIVYKVVDSRRRSRRSVAPATVAPETRGGIPGQEPGHSDRVSGLTNTLVLVSTTYVLCVAPIVIFPIGQPYWSAGASRTRRQLLTLLETIAVLVMYVNHAVNFALYFLSGVKFRHDVKALLCYRCRKRGRDPSTVTMLDTLTTRQT